MQDVLDIGFSDLVLNPADDIGISSTNDVDTWTGLESIIYGRIRELTTPFGLMARYVRDIEGLKILDGDYGNIVYLWLSEPSNSLPMKDIANECERIMLKDPFVLAASATPSYVANVIKILVEFTLVPGNTGSFSFDVLSGAFA